MVYRSNIIYKVFHQRTPVHVAWIIAGCIAMEYGINQFGDYVWAWYNKGIRFEDLEPVYREKGFLVEKGFSYDPEDEEDDDDEDEF